MVLGAFGAVVLTTAAAYAETVFSDDVIAKPSLCVGADCSTGQNYGADTVRLRENALRIHFDDTSSGEFPGNDWRIIANDQASGGLNYLAFEDSTGGRVPFRVEAGASNNALYVSGYQGRIGIGTSSPLAKTHIADGNTPTVRLEQNGSSGWSPQTWDIAGNEANFFIRDATGGSSLPFRIRPGAPDNTLYLAANGDIGLGTREPSAALHVKSSKEGESPHLLLENSHESNSTVAMRLLATATATAIDVANADGTFRIDYDDGDEHELELDADGNLIINGSLVANGSSFPDYVFEDEYRLMSLPDVERYIQANGHLPNVPSAREVAENGMNMTDVQKILMEKVEELTLHAIDQHHAAVGNERIIQAQDARLEEQAQQLKTQGARLDALEKRLEMLISASM